MCPDLARSGRQDSACNAAQGLAAGSRVSRSYDQHSRLKTLSFPDTRGNQTWSYFADGKVHQVRTTNVPGTQDAFNTYAWDARGNLVTETLAVPAWYTYSIGYGYDANNSLARVTYPSGRNVDYHPNALGQPQRVIDAAPGSTAYAHAMTWHPNGTLAGYTYGNGITFTMSPNARGLPHHVKHGAVVENFHDYDASGNVSAILDLVRGAAGHRWMDYDGLDRLTHMGSATLAAIPGSNHHVHYTYDALDNLETQKMPSTSGGHVRDWRYCYNAANQLAFIRSGSTSCNDGAATVALGYDSQGNVGWRNEKLFDFDEGNRLREIYSENPYTILERYRYDAHGRRILAMNWSSGVVLSQYAMDGKLMFQDSSRPAQNHAIDHIYLAGSLLAQREVSHATGVATVKYQHTDALGSPVAVTDAAGGLIERVDHEPYGKALGSPANTGNDRPGYTGHVEDRATGLTYMQQRYYDPQLGLFLSVDPVTAYDNPVVHFHRYRYANNSPYRFTDPDGRGAWAGAGVGAGLEILVQTVEIGVGMRDGYDRGDIFVSAGAGATGVGAAKLLDRAVDLGKMAKVLLNRGADASVSAGSQLAKDGEVSLTDTALDVVGGATVGNAVGSAAAGRAERSAANRVLQRQADRAERLGGSSARPSRQEAAASARAAQRGQVSDAATTSGAAASNATSSANEIRQTVQDREDRR